MAGDLHAKQVDLTFRLIKKRGRLLRDCANDNSCLIYGPDTSTTTLYNSRATLNIQDFVLTKDQLLHSGMSSDQLLVLIDTRCQSSFLKLHERPDYRWTNWAKFQGCLKEKIPSAPK